MCSSDLFPSHDMDGIVDVFPINSLVPVRIEFFDDEIDSLREYELASKRSLRNISTVSVLPLAETDAAGKPEMFLSYLEGQGVVVFDEPMRIREQVLKIIKENPELKKKIFGWEDMVAAAQVSNVIYTALISRFCSFSCWRNCRLSLCPSSSNPIPVPINPYAACEAACIPSPAANVGINLSFNFSCFF